MSESFAPPSVVVGIDGSRSAVRAAIWAVDEAVSRDIPLRIIYVIPPASELDSQRNARLEAHQLAEAEKAIRHALDAIESTGRALKLETEIMHGPPTATLLKSANTAAMLCIGAIGLKHFDQNIIGSTAAALVAAAHCPIAIIRGTDRPAVDHGWIVVELDGSPDSATVLACGVEEARLRGAPLRVLSSWQSRHTDVHDSDDVTDRNRVIRTHLDRRLEQWKQRYPDLDVHPVAVHGSALDYVAKNADSIQLVVVGAGDTASLREILGPTGSAALRNTSCSVLITDRQRLL